MNNQEWKVERIIEYKEEYTRVLDSKVLEWEEIGDVEHMCGWVREVLLIVEKKCVTL